MLFARGAGDDHSSTRVERHREAILRRPAKADRHLPSVAKRGIELASGGEPCHSDLTPRSAGACPSGNVDRTSFVHNYGGTHGIDVAEGNRSHSVTGKGGIEFAVWHVAGELETVDARAGGDDAVAAIDRHRCRVALHA